MSQNAILLTKFNVSVTVLLTICSTVERKVGVYKEMADKIQVFDFKMK